MRACLCWSSIYSARLTFYLIGCHRDTSHTHVHATILLSYRPSSSLFPFVALATPFAHVLFVYCFS